jgi:DNA-nicking Smr family endonuclease
VKLKLDLHDVYNRGHDIDRALRDIIEEAVRTKATVVEIIPGKGSGQLKKRVLRFMARKRSNLSTIAWRRTRGISGEFSSTSAGSEGHLLTRTRRPTAASQRDTHT